MIYTFVLIVFRSEWNLKRRCITTRNRPLKAFLIKLYGLLQYESGSSVAWNATFRGQPCFPHGMKSIFVSGAAQIGKNCVIFQQVTIGSNMLVDSGRRGAPRIGDNCYIGAGAKIIGNVRVGNNVRIGANAVVYKDVPDHSVVLSGQQLTVAGRADADNRFYSFRGRWTYFFDGRWVPVDDQSVLAVLKEEAARPVAASPA
jgi:serine O-acetyltransferase